MMIDELVHTHDLIFPPAQEISHVHGVDSAGSATPPVSDAMERSGVALDEHRPNLRVERLIFDVGAP